MDIDKLKFEAGSSGFFGLNGNYCAYIHADGLHRFFISVSATDESMGEQVRKFLLSRLQPEVGMVLAENERLKAENDQLKKEISRLKAQAFHLKNKAADNIPASVRSVMSDALDLFRRYAVIHRAKETLDGDEKARTNEAMATRLAGNASTPSQNVENSAKRPDALPDPVQFIDGQPVDLSRVQSATLDDERMTLTQVSGEKVWATINMQVIEDWAAIRRAQVWGKQ